MRFEETPTGPVAKAADTIIGQGAIGAVLIVMLGLLVWLFVKFIASQTERVNEKEKAAERNERSNADQLRVQLANTAAIEKLAANVEGLSKAVDRNTRESEEVKRGLNMIVVELVGVRRRPSTGTMQAVRNDPRREREG